MVITQYDIISCPENRRAAPASRETAQYGTPARPAQGSIETEWSSNLVQIWMRPSSPLVLWSVVRSVRPSVRRWVVGGSIDQSVSQSGGKSKLFHMWSVDPRSVTSVSRSFGLAPTAQDLRGLTSGFTQAEPA